MTETSGQFIGRYEVVELLGAGGMGEVYRARDLNLRREVAIKVLRRDAFADESRRRRLEHEARAAGALNHPNLLTIFELGTHDGAPFIVSELIQGETLRSVLARGPLSPREAVSYATQIANGLEAAHGKGIIHRDLKPENIVITPDGRLKILDFGVAKLIEPISTQDNTHTGFRTEPGALVGTVTYMSPEQVSARGVDERSDIFAIGAILFELLWGRPAFLRRSSGETIAAILSEDPLSGISTDNIPPALVETIRHCLDKNPDRRFQTAHDLAFALQRDLSTASIASPVAIRPSRKRAGVLTAAGVAVAVVMAIFVIKPWRSRPVAASAAPSIGSIAILPLVDLTPGGDRDFADGLSDEITTRMTRIADLRVVPRSSTSRYVDSKKSVRDIATELNVDAVLTGSVQRARDRIRVRMQLADAQTEQSVWADDFERPIGDLLALQDDLANAVADRIRSHTARADTKRQRSVPSDAQDAYLRGRAYYNRGDAEGYNRAAVFFKEAIRLDPQNAAAYAGLAASFHQMAFFGMLIPTEAYPPAKEAALAALRLDPDLADAHLSLAIVLTHYDWDWKAAEQHFIRAIELNASSERAEDEYALLLVATGRGEEAVKHAQRALELSPLGRQAVGTLPWMLYLSRKYDAAIAQYQRSLDLDPDSPTLRQSAGDAYVAAGRDAEAFTNYLQWARMAGYPPAILDDLSRAFRTGGINDYWKKRLTLEETEEDQTGDTYPYRRATLHARLHDADGAMKWLEEAYREHNDRLIFLGVDPAFDAVREDRRFQNLLRRIALPN